MAADFPGPLAASRTERRRPAADEASELDARAMQRLAHGEIAALGELYDRHQAAVRRFVRRATANAHDADDLVQSTFLALHKSAAAFDPTQPCRAWLLGIAARLIQRERTTGLRWARLLRRFWPPRPGWSSDPERAHAARHELARLERALSDLSESKRVVLILAEVEGLGGEEIAAALRIPIGTVWTRLHHARRQLLRALDDGEDES